MPKRPDVCPVLGCERPARGHVLAVQVEPGLVVPEHECKFCSEHPCQMEIAVRRRAKRA